MATGCQFLHIEGFSRKNDENGRTVTFVLDEAERRPNASTHVALPNPPETVFGISIPELRALHDERVLVAKDTMKNGRTRAIRSTQQTLGTVIASHPYEISDVLTDPSKAAEVKEWERRTVEWLKGQFGSQLVSVLRHTDERYCHLHCYLLPSNDMMKVSEIHPGYLAKAAIMSAGPGPGEDEKALNRRGDRGYRSALRAWQDHYFHDVGAPSGLTRIGPNVRRLKRAEWHAEMQVSQALKQSMARAEAVNAKRLELIRQTKQEAQRFVERTKQEVSEALHSAKKEAAAIRAEAVAIRTTAEREMQASNEASAAALFAQDRARQEQMHASTMLLDAVRFKGWGGRLRAFWDSLRESKLAFAIRQEVAVEIERVHSLVRSLRQRLRDEEKKRIDAERRAHEAMRDVKRALDAAHKATIERDRALAMLPRTPGQKLVMSQPAFAFPPPKPKERN
ncbi:hypothetical protein [Rhizobium tubonense]|uniref:hypothetical protein n=1 Tax=Rhizobium tubonense TaxID=484088 RepID=UPI0011B3CBD5|nr:hypothetical protein [Rhizobium tubonense]